MVSFDNASYYSILSCELTLKSRYIYYSIMFAIAVVLFEIPTGYFSDVLGRKKSLIIGMFFGALGLGIYAISREFW